MLSRNTKKRVPTQERLKAVIQIYKKTSLFHFIDDRITNRFRRRLRNDQFTILSSNCMGGVIYHRLGKQFLSPTINMFFAQPDFVNFVLFLDYYLDQDLHFIETDRGFPVAELQGNGAEIPTIRLNFNHDKIPDTAIANWEKRKKRIHRDNLFVMLYKLDGVTIEQLKSLETVPCKGRVVFTSVPIPEIPWSVYIKPIMSHRYPYNYLEMDAFGVRYYEKKFDFVSFLNGDLENYRGKIES